MPIFISKEIDSKGFINLPQGTQFSKLPGLQIYSNSKVHVLFITLWHLYLPGLSSLEVFK